MAGMRAWHAALVLALACVAVARADEAVYKAPMWACSPAPSGRNIMCPAPADGDRQRCNMLNCAPDAGCATQDCNPVQGRIQANKTIVLDAWLQRGATCIKQTWTVADCCRACQHTPECNAWSYCNDPKGCGNGCLPDIHNFQFSPDLNLLRLDPVDHPDRLNPEHKCTPDGAWPYSTCSLKYVAGPVDVTAPPVVLGSVSIGWISGAVPKASASAEPPALVEVPLPESVRQRVAADAQRQQVQQMLLTKLLQQAAARSSQQNTQQEQQLPPMAQDPAEAQLPSIDLAVAQEPTPQAEPAVPQPAQQEPAAQSEQQLQQPEPVPQQPAAEQQPTQQQAQLQQPQQTQVQQPQEMQQQQQQQELAQRFPFAAQTQADTPVTVADTTVSTASFEQPDDAALQYTSQPAEEVDVPEAAPVAPQTMAVEPRQRASESEVPVVTPTADSTTDALPAAVNTPADPAASAPKTRKRRAAKSKPSVKASTPLAMLPPPTTADVLPADSSEFQAIEKNSQVPVLVNHPGEINGSPLGLEVAASRYQFLNPIKAKAATKQASTRPIKIPPTPWKGKKNAAGGVGDSRSWLLGCSGVLLALWWQAVMP